MASATPTISELLGLACCHTEYLVAQCGALLSCGQSENLEFSNFESSLQQGSSLAGDQKESFVRGLFLQCCQPCAPVGHAA